MVNLHEKIKKVEECEIPHLFFEFYSFLDLVFAVDNLIGVLFVCFKLFVDAVFDGECCNTFLVGFGLESLFVELQGDFFVFQVFFVDLFEGHFYFHCFS